MGRKKLSLLLALITICLWASLATFGNLLLHLPPFYIVSFLIGSIPGFFKPREMFPPWRTLIWGVFGYFGYHFCLFYAFRFAPPLEANLINYLWPVIMVLLGPLFFKESKLKFYHLLGGFFSIAGCFILVAGFRFEFKQENFFGYFLALTAAFIWPIYSLGKKNYLQIRFGLLEVFALFQVYFALSPMSLLSLELCFSGMTLGSF